VAAPAASSSRRAWRFVFIVAGAASLVTGLWGGLDRLGLAMPGDSVGPAVLHGALMISGFLGTVISLERAVAIGRWWAYSAPALAAAGAVALLAGEPVAAASAFLLAGLALVVNSAFVVRRQLALFTVALAVAAACWLAGTVAWLAGAPMTTVTGWWLSFLILTIAGERLELSRLLSPPRTSQFSFAMTAALIVAGFASGELGSDAAWLSGIGLLAATAWLLRYDIALRTIRLSGQARFTAACLIGGYLWLGAAGLLLLVVPPETATYSRDVAIHAIAIGFVLSMIFGHAPIILPAVLGLRIRYGKAAYVPLALLHLSVLLRLFGDLAEIDEMRVLSGLVTIVAIVGYAVTLIVLSRKRAPA
jgi:hypothetical protein